MFKNCQNYHLGHFIYEKLANNPNGICQTDAATGTSETCASVLSRSIRLAKCFQQLGLKPGDVLALGGRNHLDLNIPYYAAAMCGLPIAGVDPFYKFDEIKTMFRLLKPKISFCQKETYNDIVKSVEELGLETKIFTFDGEKSSFNELIETHGKNGVAEEDFKPVEYDGGKIYAWLVSTSGTTGVLKFAAFHHDPILKVMEYLRSEVKTDLRGTCSLNLSPVQWISGFFNSLISLLFDNNKVQTSAPATTEHVIDIINTYKPLSALIGPHTVSAILRHPKNCDWTCFKQISLTGSRISKELMLQIREKVGPRGMVVELYGQTESLGAVLQGAPFGPIGNCGKIFPFVKVKLVDPDTEKEITEPNKIGEIWVKGYRFTEYYNMPEETSKAITTDGWFRTGDLLYRDENGYFFYYDRIKMLIKYNNYCIAPLELEEVILKLEGVGEVAVTSIPDRASGELPVACVVRVAGSSLTEQQVKNAVAEKLSDYKQLRGGVIFMDSLPTTSTGKIARGKLRELVKKLKTTD